MRLMIITFHTFTPPELFYGLTKSVSLKTLETLRVLSGCIVITLIVYEG